MLRRIASGLAIALLFANILLRCEKAAAEASAPSTPQDLLEKLTTAQRDLRTLYAEFVQKSRVNLFKQEMQSFGRLLFERPAEGPARLCWEYLQPDPSTLVLVGDKATLRMGNRNGTGSQSPTTQVFDTGANPSLRAIFAQLRLWLGLGAGAQSETAASTDKQYTMRVGGEPAKLRPALLLFPHSEGGSSLLGKTFSRIELHIDARTWQLSRLLLVEQSGDEKEITFTRVRRNVALPAHAFE